jgi:AmmeMemoRadiSam system protein B
MNAASRIRPAAVAGRFYPADPAELRAEVRRFLADAPHRDGPSPKAVIAPHAGYMYSGPIAGSAFAPWLPDRDRIRRVVLVGPSHRVALRGLAVPSAESFATPLGVVPVDLDLVRTALQQPAVAVMDEAHAFEHALEVELPFLQEVLSEFKILPLVAGEASPEEVARVLDSVWGGEETRFAISSDLSHYLDWDTAGTLDWAGLREDQACGRVGIRGMLLAAHRRGLAAQTLDLRNSGDTAGPRDRVVGYGAFGIGGPRK